MDRRQCLEQAIVCVCEDREATHGNPRKGFRRLAALWGVPLHEVPLMMAEVKLERIRTGRSDEVDHYKDAAGDLALACEMATEEDNG